MKPIEWLYGPVGVQRVEKIDGEYHVVCINGLDKYEHSFGVDKETAIKIRQWLMSGKPGLIQHVFPELTIEQREMMISGLGDF